VRDTEGGGKSTSGRAAAVVEGDEEAVEDD